MVKHTNCLTAPVAQVVNKALVMLQSCSGSKFMCIKFTQLYLGNKIVLRSHTNLSMAAFTLAQKKSDFLLTSHLTSCRILYV